MLENPTRSTFENMYGFLSLLTMYLGYPSSRHHNFLKVSLLRYNLYSIKLIHLAFECIYSAV